MIDPATLRFAGTPLSRNVTDERIQYWLTDAGRIVTEDWGDDFGPRHWPAAYHMSANRVPGMTLDASSSCRWASRASVRQAWMSACQIAASIAGSGATRQASRREFVPMLRRNRGGPRLVGYVEPCGGGRESIADAFAGITVAFSNAGLGRMSCQGHHDHGCRL